MNTDQMIEYLTILEPDLNYPHFWCGIHPQGEGPNLQAIGTIEEMLPRLIERNKEGYGIYTTVNAITPTMEGGFPRRRAEDVTRVRACVADWDDKHRMVINPPLETSMVVETSPGKYHLYWLVEGDFPLEEYANVQRGVVAAMGTDKSVIDLPRVLRVPGFMHTKGKQTMVKLRKSKPNLRYTFSQLKEAFPYEATPKFSTWEGGIRPRSAMTHAIVHHLYGPYIPSKEGYNVPCAWADAHTTPDTATGTMYFPPTEQNGGQGYYKCMHAHCATRTAEDYDKFIQEKVMQVLPGRGK